MDKNIGRAKFHLAVTDLFAKSFLTYIIYYPKFF